jgi:hypothetical protein
LFFLFLPIPLAIVNCANVSSSNNVLSSYARPKMADFKPRTLAVKRGSLDVTQQV